MNKRFAIFDMDGTLVDSMAFWQRLGREFLASQNITERVDEVLERIIPMTMIESAALFIQEFGLSRTGRPGRRDECHHGTPLSF